ncbi:MAG: ankyrin repeat domain-containing protein, partial [Bacteroidetes bacterium]|nr:ankyrin repeat domain-containing protein [Bacteroidota bacterium]
AKYGRLEMVKILVAKGADINYTYHGSYKPADGQTPATYAEKFHHQDVADYLRSVTK